MGKSIIIVFLLVLNSLQILGQDDALLEYYAEWEKNRKENLDGVSKKDIDSLLSKEDFEGYTKAGVLKAKQFFNYVERIANHATGWEKDRDLAFKLFDKPTERYINTQVKIRSNGILKDTVLAWLVPRYITLMEKKVADYYKSVQFKVVDVIEPKEWIKEDGDCYKAICVITAWFIGKVRRTEGRYATHKKLIQRNIELVLCPEYNEDGTIRYEVYLGNVSVAE